MATLSLFPSFAQNDNTERVLRKVYQCQAFRLSRRLNQREKV